MQQTRKRQRSDQPGAAFWFLILKNAVARNDFKEASRAQAALRRLGVEVQFRRCGLVGGAR